MSVAALIVAAGRGARAASESGWPKQYCSIGGVPMLQRTIGAFAAHPRVDDVLVVIHPDDMRALRDREPAFRRAVASGRPGRAHDGKTRSRAGLEALAKEAPSSVLIHDAARPFVDAPLIARVIDSLETHDGALPCLPVTDTLKRASGGRMTGTVERDQLLRAQTPQGFRFDAILAAHRAAASEARREFTDDAGIAEWFGSMLPWSKARRRTASSQRPRISAWPTRCCEPRAARSAGTIRVATGYDVHGFGPGDAVILCGVKIPHTKKLSGHSDADVALHALTDALLGVIAEGDIGVHFPPSDARWRGAASELFLKHAAWLGCASAGGEIVHVDVTLHLRGVRASALIAMQCVRRSPACSGSMSRQVSIKATTNEGLGFIGRGEGIAAMATATVNLP